MSLAPGRILDTRANLGTAGPVGGGETIAIPVLGQAGIPSSGVSSVVLNVTVTDALGDGYVTVYPTGVPRPTASNINFPAGKTVANLVTVAVGTDGRVSF